MGPIIVVFYCLKYHYYAIVSPDRRCHSEYNNLHNMILQIPSGRNADWDSAHNQGTAGSDSCRKSLSRYTQEALAHLDRRQSRRP